MANRESRDTRTLVSSPMTSNTLQGKAIAVSSGHLRRRSTWRSIRHALELLPGLQIVNDDLPLRYCRGCCCVPVAIGASRPEGKARIGARR